MDGPRGRRSDERTEGRKVFQLRAGPHIWVLDSESGRRTLDRAKQSCPSELVERNSQGLALLVFHGEAPLFNHTSEIRDIGALKSRNVGREPRSAAQRRVAPRRFGHYLEQRILSRSYGTLQRSHLTNTFLLKFHLSSREAVRRGGPTRFSTTIYSETCFLSSST